MCGILGIYSHEDISKQILYGLVAIQHRGQDAAGIITFNQTFKTKKGLGLVNQIFKDEDFESLKSNIGIGHVRYATYGSNDITTTQPVMVSYPFGIAMVHNGNVTNFEELKKNIYENHHRLLNSSNDVALILHTFASVLETKNLNNITTNDIFDTVHTVQQKVKGAYSVIAIIANYGLLAFTDLNGIRPLLIGKKENFGKTSYAFSSESSCFDYLEFETIRDLNPGEAIFIDNNHNIHFNSTHTYNKQTFCVFEYIYFAKEDSVFHDRLVAKDRVNMGKSLAESFLNNDLLKPDIIIDVPSSSYFSASGLAEQLNIPYRRGLAKNNNIGRSFILSNQIQRDLSVRQKMNPIKDIVCGKKIAVVDDSIVRGTTSKHIIKLLKDAKAKEIYFVSSAPPIKFPCIYGIDMCSKSELIAATYSIEQITEFLGADVVIYQSVENLKKIYNNNNPSCCFACFSGEYPTETSKELFQQIEQEKKCSKRN